MSETSPAPLSQDGAKQAPSPPAEESAKHSALIKVVVLGLFVGMIGFAYVQFGDELSLESVAKQEAALRQYQADQPILVYGIAFAIYVAVTGLSLPGATALTLVYGWYFRLLPGVVLVSFASTLGAAISFLLSRYLFREAIQGKFGERLETFNKALEREGAFYLFTLRLIPAVPFFVINVVMGLTPMRVSTYWWVSQIGMLPATIVYVYAGSTVPDLNTLADRGAGGILTPQLFVALAVLGLFPLVVKKIMQKFRPVRAGSD